MGSAAPHRRDPARDLLLQIEALALEASESGHRINADAVATLISDALERPGDRCLVLIGLAHYLSRCMQGFVPDLSRWYPPGL